VDAGFAPARLSAAVELAQQRTVAEPQDFGPVILSQYAAREPGFRLLGPTGTRAGGSGLVRRGGYVVAQWGDVERTRGGAGLGASSTWRWYGVVLRWVPDGNGEAVIAAIIEALQAGPGGR
jgi:hypothetical protein